jgi:hypothetical protein
VITTFPEHFHWQPEVAVYVLTPTHLDAFSVGAVSSLFPPRDARCPLLGSSILLVAAGALVIWFAHPGRTPLGYPLGLRPCYAFLWGYSLLNGWAALLIQCLVRRQLAVLRPEAAPRDWKDSLADVVAIGGRDVAPVHVTVSHCELRRDRLSGSNGRPEWRSPRRRLT